MALENERGIILRMSKRPINPAIIARKRQAADQRHRHFVKEWRKFRGLTQERLAERTPFTTGAISQLETGRTKYTQDMIEALAFALECEPGDLLSRDPTKEGEVVDLLSRLSDENKDAAIKMLKALAS